MNFKEEIIQEVKQELLKVSGIGLDDIFPFYKHSVRIDLNKLGLLDSLIGSKLSKKVVKKCWHIENNIWGFYGC